MAYPLSNSIGEYLAPRAALAPVAGTGAAQTGALIDRQGFLSGVGAVAFSTSGGVTGGAVWGYWQSTSDSTGATGWSNVLSNQSLTPATQPYPILGLTSVTASGGAGYAANDTITLQATLPSANGVTQGTQTAAIVLKVLTVTAGAITTVAILNPGAFTAAPVALTQASTSGAGAGGVFTASAFGNLFSAAIGAGPNASGVLSVPINLAVANRYVRLVLVAAPTGGTPASIISAMAYLAGADHLPTA